MKIGILKVDSVLPEFRNRHGDYPQMLVQILQLNSMQHKKKLQFKTFDVEKGDYEGESATVLEAPVRQDGLKLYIAIDSDSFHPDRPGNGGIRLLHYPSEDQAIDDAPNSSPRDLRVHLRMMTSFLLSFS